MPHTADAFFTINKNIEWFKKRAGNPKSLLYIGWRHDCHPWWWQTFCPALGIEKIGVLEIFNPNFQDLQRRVETGRMNVRPILGDARKIDEYVRAREYDVIFWDHGPEHVSLEDLNRITPLLFSTAGRMLLYCCPWGNWPQHADGNPDEEHKNSVMDWHLTALGMDVVTTGHGPSQDQKGELIAFRFSLDNSLEGFSK